MSKEKKIQKCKEEFDKNPKDTLKHIIDKLNSELNSILHEYDFEIKIQTPEINLLDSLVAGEVSERFEIGLPQSHWF